MAAAGGRGGAAPVLVFDVTTQGFEEQVLRASLQRPVVVDFWAPWCGPCKQLTPALESAVKAAGGAVLLAKVNTDANRDLAQAFRIQSIPTVYAFFQGQPVDGFQGALPDSQVKQFIARLAKLAGGAEPVDPAQMLTLAEEALAEGRGDEALELFQAVLELEPQNPKAMAGQMRALIATGQADKAQAALDALPQAMSVRGEFQAVRSQLQLQKELAVTVPERELMARLAADPTDRQAQYDLALTRFAQGQRAAAVDLLLDLIKADRAWNDEAARKQVLKFFDAMGPADPVTLKGRRRLSSLLFS